MAEGLNRLRTNECAVAARYPDRRHTVDAVFEGLVVLRRRFTQQLGIVEAAEFFLR